MNRTIPYIASRHSENRHSALGIRHSAFSIRHSAFGIRHSAFGIRKGIVFSLERLHLARIVSVKQKASRPHTSIITPITLIRRTLFFSHLLVWSLLTTVPAFSQQVSVRGFVSDSESEQPLQGAAVGLRAPDGTLRGAISDGDGYFILNRIPAGSYTLFIRFIGYATYEEELTLDGLNSIERTILLTPIEGELDEVVVESEVDAGISAVAAGLETVVPAQIERVPMPGVTGDLASYLQTVPGITIQGDRGGQFFVRGGALDQNLAMIDGIPVYMPFHVLSFYSAFPEEIIDRANVYTGGFGARHGTRISSIMDVQARNGNKQNIAGTLSIAPFLSTARLEGPIIKNRVSIIASARQSLIEDIMPSIFDQKLPYFFGDQFVKIHALLNPQHSFSLTGLHTFDRGDIAGTEKTFQGDIIAEAKNDSSEVAWNNLGYGGTYTFLSDRLPLMLDLSANRSEMSNEMGPRDARERISKILSNDYRADLTLSLNQGRLMAGGLLRTSTFRYALGGQFADIPEEAEEDLTEVTSYLEADWQPGNFSIQPGLHLYALPDRNQQWVDPRLRVSYWPTGPDGPWQFNAAWGIYHQAIAGLNDQRDIGNLFTAWTPVPADQPIPTSMHALTGVNILVNPKISLAVEGFYKDFDGLSVPIFDAVPRFTTQLQSADGSAYGFDSRLDFKEGAFWFVTRMDGYLSYAYSEVMYETAAFEYRPAHDRRHQFSALLQLERDELGLTLQFQYGSGLPFTESAGFDTWMVLTPDVNVASEPGQERIIYNDPFRGRQPSYSRMDFWIQRRVEYGRSVATLRAGIINVMNRDNLFYFDLFTFKRIDQLPLTPSVGFKIELR